MTSPWRNLGASAPWTWRSERVEASGATRCRVAVITEHSVEAQYSPNDVGRSQTREMDRQLSLNFLTTCKQQDGDIRRRWAAAATAAASYRCILKTHSQTRSRESFSTSGAAPFELGEQAKRARSQTGTGREEAEHHLAAVRSYAGEDAPRTVCPTSYGFIQDKEASSGGQDGMQVDSSTNNHKYFLGDSAGPSVYRPGMNVYRAVNEGVVTDWAAMERIIEHTMR